MALIHLTEASAAFAGRRVLGPVSLTVYEGQRIALVGQSGAGKSTLLDLLYAQARDRAALVPQELGLVPSLSVFHNVFMGRLSSRPTWYNLANLVRPFRRERQRIQPLLDQLHLGDKIFSPASQLSGGEKQRTAVARALYQKAGLLLADEPVSALDGPLAADVMAALAEHYPTSVIALHDVELALRYSSRMIGIRDGLIVLDEDSHRLNVQDVLPIY